LVYGKASLNIPGTLDNAKLPINPAIKRLANEFIL